MAHVPALKMPNGVKFSPGLCEPQHLPKTGVPQHLKERFSIQLVFGRSPPKSQHATMSENT